MTGLLALDVQRALLEVEVGPGERERFGDASAGADEQFGEGSVVRGAGVEVAVDLGAAEVVEFALVDWQGGDELAEVALQQLEAAGVGERAGECRPGVVDRLG